MLILYWHIRALEELAIELWPIEGGALVAAEDLTEAEEVPTLYTAEIADLAAGSYLARILRDGRLLYLGSVTITAAGSGPYVVDDPRVIVVGGQTSVSSFSAEALAQLAARRSITVAVPALVGRHLSHPLVRGDSYLAVHDRAITFARADFPDLAGDEDVTLTARKIDGDEAATIVLTGSVTVTTATKVVSIEATSEESRAWQPGAYRFDVQVSLDAENVATFVGPDAHLIVLDDVTIPDDEEE